MAIVYDSYRHDPASTGLPLLVAGHPARTVAWRGAEAVSAAQFLAHVQQVAAELPSAHARRSAARRRPVFAVRMFMR